MTRKKRKRQPDEAQKNIKKIGKKHGEGFNNNDKGISRSPRRKYKIHLRNAKDVRRLLSSTINELRRNEIDSARAGKIIYGASVLINIFEQCLIEERVKRLEDAVKLDYTGQ